MLEKLNFKLIARQGSGSDFDWMNIECGSDRIGKVRGLIDGDFLTINSINVFSRFEKHGYAKATIDMFKKSFQTIVADRVRPTAKGFWKKMGFIDKKNGNYIWKK